MKAGNRRHYKLQEVIDACTNIVAGKVKSVDNKRLWVILQVEEDVLGKSGLEEIKINLAVGQRRSGTSPTTMVRYFKKGAPFVIFYDSHYGQLNSVGYVDGAWFQCKTHIGERPDWKKRWWTFTHIEIYMRRTFNGKATDLQKLVKNTLKKHNTGVLAQTPAPTFDKAGKNDIKVLVFTGFRCKTEFRTLCRFRKIGEYQFSFQETQNRQMFGSICHFSPFLKFRVLIFGWVDTRVAPDSACLFREFIIQFERFNSSSSTSGQADDFRSIFTPAKMAYPLLATGIK